jgi:hypothetical protein
MGGAPNSSTNLAAAAASGDGEPGSTSTSKPSTPLAGASSVTAAAGDAGSAGAGAAGSAAAGDALNKKRAYKEKWQEGIALFNSKPKKGIALLQVSVLCSWARSSCPADLQPVDACLWFVSCACQLMYKVKLISVY